MKTLYESILDSDFMDKADKKVEFVGLFRDMLKKGVSKEYSAAKVKKLANEFIKKYDILPHKDEWPEIVQWFNTHLNVKWVPESPIEYGMTVYREPRKTVEPDYPEYIITLSAYWRSYYVKDGERHITKKASGGTSILKFNYFDTSDWKGKSEKYTLEACAVSDTKWAKRLASEFNRKPRFDNKANFYFVI